MLPVFICAQAVGSEIAFPNRCWTIIDIEFEDFSIAHTAYSSHIEIEYTPKNIRKGATNGKEEVEEER